MKWVNHVAIAGAVTAVAAPPLVPVAILGSTAPDWMEWVYTATTRRKIKHRGATHVLAYWLAGLGFGLFIWDFHHIITAFSAGGLSHVLADSFTLMGVPLGWWSDRKFHLFGGRLKTGLSGEYWVTGAIVLACVGVGFMSRSWGGDDGGFSPFFFDYGEFYKQGLVDPKEWREHRFRFF